MPAESDVSTASATVPAVRPPARASRRGSRRVRRLTLLTLLAVVGAAALCLYPPAWHAGLRALLTEAAARRGLVLEIGGMEGGLLDGIVLHRLTLQSRGETLDAGTASRAVTVQLRARRVELTFTAPALPFFGRPKPAWVERLVVEGIEGDGTLGLPPADNHSAALNAPGSAARNPPPPDDDWASWWRARSRRLTRAVLDRLAPASFALLNRSGETLTLSRGPDLFLRVSGLQLTGEGEVPGRFLAREVQARAPGGFSNRYAGWHGTTGWREGRLTLRDVALAPGVDLAQATVDVPQLVHGRRLNGKVAVRALGGELRGEGSVGLASPGRGLQVEVAGAMNAVAVAPLAALLGVREPTGGTVRAGQFSFRGDPERLADATGSLRAEAVDFQFGERRWQQLRVGATVLNHRVTVHDLELVQSRNRLTLNGEFPLPPAVAGAPLPPGWWQPNFSCQVDARLEDLRAFGRLLGPGFPGLTGRMTVRGALASDPAGGSDNSGLAGSLEIEGSRLSVRGAPIDSLRTSLRFRHGELEVNAFHATHAGDTLTGKGAGRIAGPFRYAGELKAHVKDLAPYAAALPRALFPAPLAGALTLDWSGDGAAQSHNGAFRARLGGFLAKGGPAALPRAVDVDAEATYSPDSLSFRRLLLRESTAAGGPKGSEFQARFENGALPLTQNSDALAAGHLFRPEGTLAGRLELREFALDLLPPLWPTLLAAGTDGRVAGWLDLGGTAQSPRLTGALQVRKARLRWAASRRGAAGLDADNVQADLRLNDQAALLDLCTGERPGDGGAFSLGGRMDWTDRGTPATLGLALGAKNLRLVDDENLRARADLNLVVLGPPGAPEIAGEIRVREGGRCWRRLELDPEPEEGASARSGPLPLGDLDAGPLRDAALDLRITAAAPLLMEGSNGPRGELAPDLWLGGTGRQPVLTGALTFRRAKVFLSREADDDGPEDWPRPPVELEVESGALHFGPAGPPDDPTVALTAFQSLPATKGSAAGRLRVDLFGPLSAGDAVFSSEPPRWSSKAVEDFLVDGQPLPPSSGTSPLTVGAPLPPGDFQSLAVVPPGPDAEPDAEPVTLPARKLYLRLR